jgi:hypothetical protein
MALIPIHYFRSRFLEKRHAKSSDKERLNITPTKVTVFPARILTVFQDWPVPDLQDHLKTALSPIFPKTRADGLPVLPERGLGPAP